MAVTQVQVTISRQGQIKITPPAQQATTTLLITTTYILGWKTKSVIVRLNNWGGKEFLGEEEFVGLQLP